MGRPRVALTVEEVNVNTTARRAATAAIAILIATIATAFAQGGTLKPATVLPDQLTFAAAPNGTMQAAVVGDQTKAGLYAVRTKFPAGLKILPHFHPDDRIVLVQSGTLYVGFGETFDEAKMRALPAGSVFTEPAREAHFSWAKDGPVTLHVVGMGPSGTTWLPRKD